MGCTQEELAEQLDVSRQSISKWESAQSVPDISKIIKMAEVFSVSTDYLLRDEIETMDETNLPVTRGNLECVTIGMAHEFINVSSKKAKLIGLGVFLCIFSTVPVILSGLVENNLIEVLGVFSFFLLVASGVGIFIYSDNIMEDFEYI